MLKELFRDCVAYFFGVVPVQLCANNLAAISCGHRANDSKAFSIAAAMDADGNLAAAAQGTQRNAFGGHGEAGIRIVKEGHGSVSCSIASPAFDCQGALSGRWT